MKAALVLDCQTTGATPEHGSLLELAWLKLDQDGGASETTSFLVRTETETNIPGRITKITGITAQDVEERGVEEEQVWRALKEDLTSLKSTAPPKLIVHYAQFEKRFITDLAQRLESEAVSFEFVCTHAIARRLLPNLPRHTLRALAGFFGCGIDEFRRASDHVRGTLTIWQALLAMLKEQGITTFDQIAAFSAQKAPKRDALEFPLDPEQLKDLPKTPGVYYFKGYDQRTLYVGKATDLKSRVSSYFRARGYRASSTLEMLSQTFDIQVRLTNTPLEAALLEAEEITSIRPQYNTALRTSDPEVYYLMPDNQLGSGAPPPKARGPFTGARGAHSLLALLRLWKEDDIEPASHEQLCGVLALDYPICPPQQLLLEAAKQLRDVYPGEGNTWESLLAFGSLLWFCLKDLDTVEDEESGDERAPEHTEDNGDETLEWTLERLTRHLAWSIASVSRNLRRMQWLNILSQGDLHYTFKEQHWSLPPKGHPGIRSRKDYDRLSVLNAEIRRLIRTGNFVSLTFESGIALEAAAVAKILEWF